MALVCTGAYELGLTPGAAIGESFLPHLLSSTEKAEVSSRCQLHRGVVNPPGLKTHRTLCLT